MGKMIKLDENAGYMALPGLKCSITIDDMNKLRAVSIKHMFAVVTKIVCEVVGVKSDELFKNSRKGNLPKARQLICYYLCVPGHMKLKQVGILLRPSKPFNHTTIIHHRDLIEDILTSQRRDAYGEEMYAFILEIDLELKHFINESNSANG